jgi:glycosyltransferase involved in cell wall biosynthesis
VLPDDAESREMFPTSEFDVTFVEVQRPRKTVDVRIQGRYLLAFPLMLRTLRRIIKARNIDLVHFNEITDFIAGIAARSCGVRSVCHVRADRSSNPYRWLLLTTLRSTVDAVIVPSNSTSNWISADSRDLGSKLHLIYDYAFDISEYQKPVSRDDFRRELGLAPEDVLVVLVSKLITIKGHQLFIRAAEIVRRQKQNVVFVIVGDTVPGHEEEASAIRQLGQQLVPGPALRFVGPRNDLPSIYAASDVAVHCPIFDDTYPTVILLPMLAGRPVIGCAIGGISEQVADKETGLLVPPNDHGALASAIMELAADRARRESIGATARRRIFADLNPERQGRQLAELYRKVLDKGTKRREQMAPTTTAETKFQNIGPTCE